LISGVDRPVGRRERQREVFVERAIAEPVVEIVEAAPEP